MSETNRRLAREFLFEWIGVDHRNDCRGSNINDHTGTCDACKRRVQPPTKMEEALTGLLNLAASPAGQLLECRLVGAYTGEPFGTHMLSVLPRPGEGIRTFDGKLFSVDSVEHVLSEAGAPRFIISVYKVGN